MPDSMVEAPEFRALRDRVDRLEDELSAIRRQIAAPAAARPSVQYSDKAALKAVMKRVLAELEIPEDPGITPEELQQRMIEHGVRPEDCIASRAIVAAREERWPFTPAGNP